MGQDIGPYRLIRLLGQGAQSQVYLAEHRASTLGVALKLMPLANSVAESTSAQALVHPGIVGVYATGVHGSTAWLAMEPVLGSDLTRYAKPPRLLPEPLVLRVGERMAQALAHAHAQGVVHRDLKPSNVLVHWPTDTIKLADFGLARSADASQTATGLVLGSPAYMAPEQLAGGVPTAASDCYALGVTLFELLTGRCPHQGDTMGELLRQVAAVPAPGLMSLRPDLAGLAAASALDALLARLLAKRPGERLGSAAAAATELANIAAAWPHTASHTAPPTAASAALHTGQTAQLLHGARNPV
jgi:eukaryotic-like serine/threonine-protein kinase